MTMKPLTITPTLRAKWQRINAARVAAGKPKLNFPLWVKVRNRIAAVPESYDQGDFKERSDTAPCGWRACIAGETLICSRRSLRAGIALLASMEYRAVGPKAAGLLGLNGVDYGNDDEYHAFDGGADGWCAPFAQRYAAATTDRQRAAVAVAYLTSVIRTGRVVD